MGGCAMQSAHKARRETPYQRLYGVISMVGARDTTHVPADTRLAKHAPYWIRPFARATHIYFSGKKRLATYTRPRSRCQVQGQGNLLTVTKAQENKRALYHARTRLEPNERLAPKRGKKE